MFSLAGKHALVTGGGRGIGRAIGGGLLEQGAQVTIAGRNEDTLKRTCDEFASVYGERVGYSVFELRERASATAMLQAVEASGAGLDILVNNAALHMAEPLESMDFVRAQTIIDTNIMGLYGVCLAALPLLKKKGGKIINLSSIVALQGRSGIGVYSATKAAISQITRVMAIEWAQYNILVNAIAPGIIATDFTAAVQADKTMSDYFKSRILLGRLGVPEDLAACAAFLASDENTFMTGAVLAVDGGHSILM